MKKFAYYLPQFHEIKENNEWWGEGFTEWVNVKKAKPLFKNHVQPIHPLGNNYYNLLDPETLQWQASLAKKYSIDGMIFYHYYFCGRKLLERPAEILLKNKDIPMHFFFCWANHNWYKSWEGSKTLLIEQTYGSEEDWEKHFQYLLPFFKDERYEKKDNKPFLLIFDSNIPCKSKMFEYIERRCMENGFAGLYLIEDYRGYNDKDIAKNKQSVCTVTKALAQREPNAVLHVFLHKKAFFYYRVKDHFFNIIKKCNIHLVEKFNGNLLFKCMIKGHEHDDSKTKIAGLFMNWDNTSRHGYRGYIITPPSKKVFMKYMNTIKNSEYVFINAWNEWCEGMILEPTEENGYKYLEWIKEWSENNEDRIDGV